MTRSKRWEMGFETPGDQKVSLPLRTWSVVKLALWRNKCGWEIALRAAVEMVDRCEHADGCSGKESETEPCLATCPDREQRMSALVILNAARGYAPADARRPANEVYSAPTREYFSEVIAELLATQAELEAMRAVGVAATPPPNAEGVFLTQRAPPQFSAADFEEQEPDEAIP